MEKSSLRVIGAVLFTVLLTVSLAACGGGGGGGNGDGLPTELVSGIWEGTFFSNVLSQTFSVTGIITETNEIRFITSSGGQYVGNITVSGNSVSGTTTGYAPLGFTFPDSSVIGTVTFSGTVDTKKSFSGTYGGVGDSGTFSLTYNSIYERPSSIATVSDSWVYSETGYTLSAVINSDGVISANDTTGCLYSGNISIINSSYNAYRVNFNVTSCSALNGNYSGLATLIDTLNANDTLVVGVSNATTSITITFERTETVTRDTGILIKAVTIVNDDGPNFDAALHFCDEELTDPEEGLFRDDGIISINATLVNPIYDTFPATVEECRITYLKANEDPSSPILPSFTIYPNCSIINSDTNECIVTIMDIDRKRQYWTEINNGLNTPNEYPTHYIAAFNCKYYNIYNAEGEFQAAGRLAEAGRNRSLFAVKCWEIALHRDE